MKTRYGLDWKGPGFFSFLVIAFTGFYLILSSSWSGPYRASALIHPALGLLSLLLFPIHYIRTMRRDFPRAGFGRHFAVAAFMTFPVLVADPAAPGRTSLLWGYIFLLGIYVCRVSRSALRMVEPEKQIDFATAQAVLFLWIIVALTGVIIVTRAHMNGIGAFYIQHRWWSVLFLAGFLVHFAGIRVSPQGRWGMSPHPGTRWVLLLACLLGAVSVSDAAARRRETSYKLHLSTIRMENRTPEERDMKPKFKLNPALYDVTESCGVGAGCHAQAVKEFLVSNHNRTMAPGYVKKNLDEMSREVGAHNVIICAGCHIPYAAFDQTKKYPYFQKRNSFSCTFCHLINGAGLDPENKKKSWITMAYPGRHGEDFLSPGGAPRRRLPFNSRILILLNRTGHTRVFKRKLHARDVYCQSCHHLQFGALNPNPANMRKPSCVNCHMQPGKMLGLGPSRRNHFIPGANAHLPTVMGDKRGAEIVQQYAAGKLDVDIPVSWKMLWNVRYDESKAPARIPWLSMFFENLTPPRPGREWRFRVNTYNSGLGHPFPAAPLDLVQAWLEVEVWNESGESLFRSGGLDAKKQLLQDTHRLGGHMIGEDGHLVTRNRVWQVREKIVERIIPVGGSVKDDFAFTLPPGAGRLTVTARWRYRKLNQDFCDWAYGAGKMTAPPVTVGEAKHAFTTR